MTDEEMERAAASQADADRRVEPYVAMLNMRIRQLVKAMSVNMSDLTIVFPESDWEGVEAKDRPVMLFGCRVVLADVPTAMVAVPAPAGPVAYATLGTDTEGGTPGE